MLTQHRHGRKTAEFHLPLLSAVRPETRSAHLSSTLAHSPSALLMPVVVLLVTDVSGSRAQPLKPLPMLKAPLAKKLLCIIAIAAVQRAAFLAVVARSRQVPSQYERRETSQTKMRPEPIRFRRTKEGGGAPEVHLPPHRSIAAAQTTYCAFCRSVASLWPSHSQIPSRR